MSQKHDPRIFGSLKESAAVLETRACAILVKKEICQELCGPLRDLPSSKHPRLSTY